MVDSSQGTGPKGRPWNKSARAKPANTEAFFMTHGMVCPPQPEAVEAGVAEAELPGEVLHVEVGPVPD